MNFGYKGNHFVKRAGIQHKFSESQFNELKKCKTDVIYFIENYCKIITLDHGLQLFQPYEYQIRMVEAFHNNRFIVNLLPRQMGKSTIVAAYLLHHVIFNEDKMVAVLANKAMVARELLSRIQRMYENLPLWMQPGVREWNKGSMVLENNSTLMSAATSSSSIRGFAFNIIFLDEFAHVEQQNEFWESTYPVISSGSNSKVIITSTPNGLDLFYKIFSEAEMGTNEFTPIRVHWSEHPKRDEKWKEETLKNIGVEQFKQEFETEFLGSSGTLIDGATLKRLVPKTPVQNGGGLKIYQEPVNGNNYVAVVDVSRGKGLDYSAIQVIDVTKLPYQQAAVFRDNETPPAEFVGILHGVIEKFNKATCLIETNDIGGQVADLLHYDFEYDNILYTQTNGRAGVEISLYNGRNAGRGVRTTKTVKSIGCSIIKLLIEQDQLIINDFDTIHELSTFSRKGTSYEAEEGCNDDLAMCLVLFGWLSNQKYFKELTDIPTLAKLRQKTDEELLEEVPFFGYVDAAEDKKKGPLIDKSDKDMGWEAVDNYPLEFFRQFDVFQ